MATYANRTCTKCGIKRPQYNMKQVEKTSTRNTGMSVSVSPFSSNPKAGLRVHSGRTIKSKRSVWVCGEWEAHDDPGYFVRKAEEERIAAEKERKRKAEEKRLEGIRVQADDHVNALYKHLRGETLEEAMSSKEGEDIKECFDELRKELNIVSLTFEDFIGQLQKKKMWPVSEVLKPSKDDRTSFISPLAEEVFKDPSNKALDEADLEDGKNCYDAQTGLLWFLMIGVLVLIFMYFSPTGDLVFHSVVWSVNCILFCLFVSLSSKFVDASKEFQGLASDFFEIYSNNFFEKAQVSLQNSPINNLRGGEGVIKAYLGDRNTPQYQADYHVNVLYKHLRGETLEEAMSSKEGEDIKKRFDKLRKKLNIVSLTFEDFIGQQQKNKMWPVSEVLKPGKDDRASFSSTVAKQVINNSSNKVIKEAKLRMQSWIFNFSMWSFMFLILAIAFWGLTLLGFVDPVKDLLQIIGVFILSPCLLSFCFSRKYGSTDTAFGKLGSDFFEIYSNIFCEKALVSLQNSPINNLRGGGDVIKAYFGDRKLIAITPQHKDKSTPKEMSKSISKPKEMSKSISKMSFKELSLELYALDDFLDVASFILMKQVALADGEFSEDERQFIVKLFELETRQLDIAEAFMSRKSHITVLTKLLVRKYESGSPSLVELVNALFFLAEADGQIDKTEIDVIREIATGLGINGRDFDQILEGKNAQEESAEEKELRFVLDEVFDDIDFEEE